MFHLTNLERSTRTGASPAVCQQLHRDGGQGRFMAQRSLILETDWGRLKWRRWECNQGALHFTAGYNATWNVQQPTPGAWDLLYHAHPWVVIALLRVQWHLESPGGEVPSTFINTTVFSVVIKEVKRYIVANQALTEVLLLFGGFYYIPCQFTTW